MRGVKILSPSFARWALPLALCLFASLTSCKSGTKAPETLQPVTDEEATAFATSLEEALGACDSPKLNALIDIEAAMRRAIRRSSIPKRQQNAVLRGMVDTANAADTLSELCGNGEENAIARFIRLRERDSRKSALFRISSSEGINYVEFYLGKAKDERVIADNFYAYLSGADLVESYRAPLDALFKNLDDAEKFSEVLQQLVSEPSRGLKRLASLPPEVRNIKVLQIAAVVAASKVDDTTYSAAIAYYANLFPNDPSLDLITIDGFVLTEKYTEALAAIDRLETALGGDPYLNQVRSGIVIEIGEDYAKAAELAKAAIDAEPTDTDTYFMWLTAELSDKNAAGAVDAMNALTEKFDVSFGPEDAVEYAAMFPEFAQSKEWLGYLEAHSPASPNE